MADGCSKMARNLSAYIDGELAPEDRSAIEAHVAACPFCAGELRLMAAVDADLKRLPAVEPSPFFAARVAAAAKVAAAARAANRDSSFWRRFLRVPEPAVAIMVSFIMINILTFAFNISAMENGPRRELARKVAAQFVKPDSIINPVALARLCGECSKYMCRCMHEAGKAGMCVCKDCEMGKSGGKIDVH